mmetsp:Transcript_95857/g.194893  ORF Transcript_95857/g.194893 Transcript_95857/m.194893 type:complete len:171 (+) Transcript_95857:236-748(+)
MDPVSIPPSKSLSISTDPVVRWRIFLRVSRASAAVWNSIETMCLTISFSLLTLASEIPLTSERRRVVAWATCRRAETIGNEASMEEENTTGLIGLEMQQQQCDPHAYGSYHTYRFYRVISSGLKLLDVVDGNSMLLERFKGLIYGSGLFEKRGLKIYIIGAMCQKNNFLA